MHYECGSCGALHDVALVREWGKNKESSGAGPKARCVALVPDHLGSGQLCGGDLALVKDPAPQGATVRGVTAISN